MTETALTVMLPPWYYTPEGLAEQRTGSIGRALPTADVVIRDPGGAEVPRGTVGELTVKSPSVMLGYLGRPEETAATIRDGWLHSGDGAYADEDGFLYLTDRIKDMIITGGENVYSTEVEAVLVAHPAVASAAVIGVPDTSWGEQVHAVVVLAPGADATADELIRHCRAVLAGYKCPRSIELRDALPLSAAGKVLKARLRAEHRSASGPPAPR
jgi:acyl-CoA synthetase (AMP-forming)/AMP-acid ligase II